MKLFPQRIMIGLVMAGLAVGGITANGQSDKLQPIRNDDPVVIDVQHLPLPGNLKIFSGENPAVTRGLTSNTLAARIVDRNHTIEWHPAWGSQTVGGISLRGLVGTQDGSTVMLVENTTGDHGVCSSTVICYETAHWQVIRAIWLPGQQIMGVALIPHTVLLAAYVRGQSNLDGRDVLLLIDCETGKVKATLPQNDHGRSDLALAASSDFIAVKYFNAPGIYFCPVIDGTVLKPQATGEIGTGAGFLVWDADGKQLAWADGRGLWIWNSTQRKLRKLKVPSDFTPAGMVFTSDGPTVAQLGVPLRIFTDRGLREVGIKTTGNMMWSPHEHMVYLEMPVKRSWEALSQAQYQVEEVIQPLRTRPESRGVVEQYLALDTGRLLFLTSFGNLCLLERGAKHWKKTVITAPIR